MVIIVGVYQPAASAIELLRESLGEDTIFMAVSFVGSNALAAEPGDSGEGVCVTQVVPFPSDDSVAVVASYRAALAAVYPDAIPGFISLEGYLAGHLPSLGWKRGGLPLCRNRKSSKFMKESLDCDLVQKCLAL